MTPLLGAGGGGGEVAADLTDVLAGRHLREGQGLPSIVCLWCLFNCLFLMFVSGVYFYCLFLVYVFCSCCFCFVVILVIALVIAIYILDIVFGYASAAI